MRGVLGEHLELGVHLGPDRLLAALAMGWLISRDPGFAVACGTFGFGAAATSLAVARRALVAAPAGGLLPRAE